MSLALASFLAKRYLMAEWSVYTMLLDMTRYERNFSKAYTTASNSFYVSSVVSLEPSYSRASIVFSSKRWLALWDMKLESAALFSSSFKSLAIMTGNLSSPSKNAYSRWGGSSLSSTSGDEVGSSSRARNESLLPLREITVLRKISLCILKSGQILNVDGSCQHGRESRFIKFFQA
ncbi:hypothetical protein Tco_1079879 [Tanacetum coccineum]|uniref:Uncharacterized protein n=1 Tax=Tanacetum coccineum TaxID=301880 RepID=A0ABQ5HUD5_9ASTR